MSIDTIIFDMDGVITTEEKYWACARLTVWELITQTLGLADAFGDVIHDEAAREAIAPDEMIYSLKSRAVNSNWDVAYMLACAYLANMPDATVFTALTPEDLLEAIRDSATGPAPWPASFAEFLSNTGGAKGHALIQAAGIRLASALEFERSDLLKIEGPFWWYLHSRFQDFYNGSSMTKYGGEPLQDGTVLPAEQVHQTLKTLKEAGYTLGSATGRPREELDDALKGLGLLDYFDPNRLGTVDVVRKTEIRLGLSELTKPHPFSLLRALYPHSDAEVLLDPEFQKLKRPNVVVVGDTASDVLMAKSAGCHTVGVLTGVRGEAAQKERYHLLIHAGCEAILDDITHLPDWLEGQKVAQSEG